MICILAGNRLEAQRWAAGVGLEDSEWFYPYDENELISKTNFHVVVVGSAGENVPVSIFNSIYNTARQRGRIGRK